MSEAKQKVEIGDSEKRSAQAIEEGGNTIDERKLLRKLDLILLPGVSILLLLSFLDRSNGNLSPFFLSLSSAHFLPVGNARIEGLAADTNMSAWSFRCSQLSLARPLPQFEPSRKSVPHHIIHLLYRPQHARYPM